MEKKLLLLNIYIYIIFFEGETPKITEMEKVNSFNGYC